MDTAQWVILLFVVIFIVSGALALVYSIYKMKKGEYDYREHLPSRWVIFGIILLPIYLLKELLTGGKK